MNWGRREVNKFLEIRGIEIDKKIIRIYCKKNNENKGKKGYISLIAGYI